VFWLVVSGLWGVVCGVGSVIMVGGLVGVSFMCAHGQHTNKHHTQQSTKMLTSANSTTSRNTATSAGLHARIHQEVRHVREQVEQHVHRGREEHDTLHDRIVAVEDGIDDELAEARNGKDLL